MKKRNSFQQGGERAVLMTRKVKAIRRETGTQGFKIKEGTWRWAAGEIEDGRKRDSYCDEESRRLGRLGLGTCLEKYLAYLIN